MDNSELPAVRGASASSSRESLTEDRDASATTPAADGDQVTPS